MTYHSPKRVTFQRPQQGGVAVNVDSAYVEVVPTVYPHTLENPSAYVCGIEDERKHRGNRGAM